MKDSEDAHKITEQIYKNLNDNFIPNMKQLSLSARNYYKALTNVSTAARSYSETLVKIGQTAINRSTGPTQNIGAALNDISQIYKQLEIQTEEKMKSLMQDISFPLENKLETDLKTIPSSLKKYNQEHKAIVVPFEKAQNTLTKMQKKKSRSKFSDKEAEYAQTISKAQMKLHDHRISGLQKAMTEEWNSHSFLLECVCNMLILDHNHYAKLHSMIAPNIEQWAQLYANSDTLLPNIQNMFITGANLNDYTDTENNDMIKLGSLYDDTNVSSFPIQRPPEINEPVFTQRPGNVVYARHSGKPIPEEVKAYVQAMHRHEATSDSQLSFQENDTIQLIGEKSEGWHYGFNLSNKKYGWLPLSFTKPVTSDLGPLKMSSLDDQPLTNRVKSTGDLLNSHEGHLNVPPRRSSITNNSFNDGSNSLLPASPLRQGPTHIVDSQNTVPSVHPYQVSNNKIPTPPPQPHLYSYSPRANNNVPQFRRSPDNEYQNLSSLQPNNFELSQSRNMNSSLPFPPPPSSHPEADYSDALDYGYYPRDDILNNKGYRGPNNRTST
ncbi:brain-specific angiogenesis inhibitor 1-associated protein 2-like [Octopus bimaculoides]|uniref:brain-specific angiogenesis inhibitor 1-associated protein 2-like n=1 Tax=Octopus bimaculoides TaxID=37653 RepID=UPI00071C3F55|nr:brain-specific angiogenesis inhibitor 1-associated protein 2-like [Octopus bimaculoides]|eukprot:XP_014781663.1 PREDICTED: brain-specific angiogenesis inhibitor 1-associated protein 2-like [Octopus bimaculoides]